MSEEDSTHLWILVLSFIDDGLSSHRVNQPDIEILFLPDSGGIAELETIVDSVISLDSICLHVLFDESDESCPLNLYRLICLVVQSNHKVEKVTFPQIRRRMLLECSSRQPDAVVAVVFIVGNREQEKKKGIQEKSKSG
jgi:hypothetical protein